MITTRFTDTSTMARFNSALARIDDSLVDLLSQLTSAGVPPELRQQIVTVCAAYQTTLGSAINENFR